MKSNWFVIHTHHLPLSFRLNRQVPPLLGILGSLIIVTLIFSVSSGEYPVPPLEVVKTLLTLENQNSDYQFIVTVLRLPRALVALLVGIALGVAGSITQGILRNPLASPDIIGINEGAALAAVTLIVALPNISGSWLPVAAFVGGITISLLIYGLAWKQGSSSIRLVLVGIGFSLLTGAVTDILITFGNIHAVSQALVWLAGSVYGRSWPEVRVLLLWLTFFLPFAFFMARDLNALNLGDDIARGIGTPLEWRRGFLLMTSVVLAGVAVATAGTVGFVGFVAPHIARRLIGSTYEGLLLTAGLVGGLLVVMADLIGRSLFAPIELPCGLITSILGAPYFLYLLIRKRSS